MDESGWTHDPVVVVAGGGLLLECVGWTAWAVERALGGVASLDYTIIGIFVGIAVALAACAVGVLRGLRGFAVLAACVVLLLTGFLGLTPLALVNATVIVALAWANARLRRPAGEFGRAARRDPVVLAAAGGCAAAAAAIAAWIGVWAWQQDVFDPARPGHFSPLVGIVFRAVPALVLAAAAAGILRGSRLWAAAAAGPIVFVGGIAVSVAEGVAAITGVAVAGLVLLGVVGFASTRLPWPDDGSAEPGAQ